MVPLASMPTLLYFGAFRFDPVSERLWHGTQLVSLRPKTLAVLRYFLAHPEQLITKEDFFTALWPEAYVSDGVLKVCINELRTVLQDSARAPQYIETVARRGYRFIGTVQDLASAVQPAEPPPAAPTLQSRVGERRQLTVMSCDVAGAPTVTTTLDPEDYQALLQTLTSTCRAVMARYDGAVAESGGSGLFVYFGYPVAHEDAARRAVQAGMDLLQAVKDLRAKAKAPQQLHVRIGIHTGAVVIDERRTGEHAERVAVGETGRLATYLQTLAATNALIISTATQRLVAGYAVCEQVEPPGGNGSSGAVPVYRVVETKQTLSRLDVATATGLTPLVGRDGELGLLRQQAEHVRAGQGRVVLLSGEAGIGKSRLAQLLKASLRDGEEVCVEFHCL